MKKIFTAILFSLIITCFALSPALAVSIENADDLQAEFPDARLREIVFDELDKVSLTGTGVTGADNAEILARFKGSINASGKGISNIKGIELLIKADTIDLSKNSIKDFTVLSSSGVFANNYYGYDANDPTMESDRSQGTNVYWILNENPFEKLPAGFGGRLVIKQPGTTSYTYPFNPAKDLYSFVRDNGSEKFDLTIEIGKCTIAGTSPDNDNIANGLIKLIPGELRLLKKSENTESNTLKPLNIPHQLLSATESPDGLPNKYAKISEILLNQELKLGAGTQQVIHYDTADEFGTITPGSQSFKYYQDFHVRIYDRIKLLHNDKGSASLVKTDVDTGKTLEGAVYDFYKGETLIKSDLTTNIDGQIVVRDLEQGEYSFREKKAPKGYEVDTTPIPVSIKDPINAHGSVTGGVADSVGATVTGINKTSAPLGADEMFIAGSDTSDMSLTVTGQGEFSIIVDYSALAMERQAGKLTPEPITRIFSTAGEAQQDINNMKNSGRIAGPVNINVQYAANAHVDHSNKAIPPTTAPTETTTPTTAAPAGETTVETTTQAPNDNVKTGDKNSIALLIGGAGASIALALLLISLKKENAK